MWMQQNPTLSMPCLPSATETLVRAGDGAEIHAAEDLQYDMGVWYRCREQWIPQLHRFLVRSSVTILQVGVLMVLTTTQTTILNAAPLAPAIITKVVIAWIVPSFRL